jgi:hypothetical protein
MEGMHKTLWNNKKSDFVTTGTQPQRHKNRLGVFHVPTASQILSTHSKLLSSSTRLGWFHAGDLGRHKSNKCPCPHEAYILAGGHKKIGKLHGTLKRNGIQVLNRSRRRIDGVKMIVGRAAFEQRLEGGEKASYACLEGNKHVRL